MAQNLSIAGASYELVPKIQIPKVGGGTAEFVDTSDANATASNIENGVTAYVNGVKVTGTLEMPDEYAIGGSCADRTLTGYKFKDGITSLRNYAFYSCVNLALTSLPDSITEIGTYAFYACNALALSSLPSGITSIEPYVFYNCLALALSSLPSGITSIGNFAFRKCRRITLTSLPSGVTSIGNQAFSECASLALTSLSSEITSIGTSVFNGCTSLTNLEIACQNLGTGTKIFDGCTGLKKIWIRSTCTTITAASAANAPFVNCSTTLRIYAEASAKQSGWGTYFNRTGTSGGTTVTVVYGQTTCPW